MNSATKSLRHLALIAAAATLSACGGDGGTVDHSIATTANGVLVGTDTRAPDTIAWLGVPFAKPPVGELRWRAPQDPEPWTGRKSAEQFGNACLQHGRIYGPGSNNTYDDTIATTLNQPVGSEDCLTLNVWRPANQEKKLPVIVFFYGGSNVSGYSADPAYDGAELARKAEAVVVTANYRVGIMGWLRLDPLRTGDALDDSGNFGTLDTIKALAYVHKNIDAFGGDPDNVTVMGQSAGAVNVYALMVSPQASGLFHKAVPLSGGISTTATTAVPLPSLASVHAQEMYANTLLYAIVIDAGQATDADSAKAWVDSRTRAEVGAFLRDRSAASIITTALAPRAAGLAATATSNAVAPGAAVGTPAGAPIPEGTVVPADPIAEIRAGHYNAVPVLAGNTRDEGKLFGTLPVPVLGQSMPAYKMSDADRFMAMKHFDPDAVVPNTTLEDQINAAYLPVDKLPNGWNAAADWLSRVVFTGFGDQKTNGVLAEVLNALKTQQNDVWYYRFDWDQEPVPWNDVYGAAHGFDLPFLFSNFERPSLFSRTIGGKANEAGRLALSDAMLQSLASFARTGNPNHASLGVQWQPWPHQVNFDASQTAMQITAE